MTAHKRASREQEEFVKQKLEMYYWEVFQEVASDVAQQAVANVLVVLEKSYGFKKKRLERILEDVEDMTQLMEKPTPMTHRFTSKDNIRYLSERFGIDVKKFRVEVEEDTKRRSKKWT